MVYHPTISGKTRIHSAKIFFTKKVSGQNYLILKKAPFYRQNCNFGPIWVKLHEMGARGKYLEVMRSVYSSLKARIKMLGKISEKNDILIGTEQGHSMSPELFKLYVLELSNDLNKQISDIEAPTLNSVPISHLLWADDLVLMALNKDSLQKLLHALENFCRKWGLPVSKTEVMVFNNAGRILYRKVTDLHLRETH